MRFLARSVHDCFVRIILLRSPENKRGQCNAYISEVLRLQYCLLLTQLPGLTNIDETTCLEHKVQDSSSRYLEFQLAVASLYAAMC